MEQALSFAVHHYFPLGSENSGDGLVAHAIQEAFARHCGRASFVHFAANDCNKRFGGDVGLLGPNLDRNNRHADLVIVGGSNMLQPQKARGQNSRKKSHDWGLFTDVQSLERLRKPLLLVGMGTGSSFGKPIRRYSPAAVREIRALHHKARLSAVRDQITADRLAEIGVESQCIGCPVTFLTDRQIEPQAGHLPVLVSFPPSRIVERFGGTSFMRASMQYVQWLKRSGVQFVVTLHDQRDWAVAKRWLPAGVEVFYTDRTDELIGRFEKSHLVIGFRLHAALLGVGLGKPVIPVGVDWRGLAFIDTFKLEEHSIRPFRLGQFAKLRTLTARLLDGDRQMLGPLNAGKMRFGARSKAFWQQVAQSVAGDNRAAA